MPPSHPIPADALKQHGGFVLALARSLTGNEDDARDVAQEAWLATLRAKPRLAVGLRPWLARVVRQSAWNRSRGARRRVAREAVVARPERVDARDPALELELSQQVVEAVLALAEPYKGAVLLRYYHELSVAEIAGRLEVSPNTVKTRLRRALGMLRERLDAAHGGDRAAWCVGLAGLSKPARAAQGLGAKGMTAGVGAWVVGASSLVALVPVVILSTRGTGERDARAVSAIGAVTRAGPIAEGQRPVQGVGGTHREPALTTVPPARVEDPRHRAFWRAVGDARQGARRFDSEEHLSAPELARLRALRDGTLPSAEDIVLFEHSLADFHVDPRDFFAPGADHRPIFARHAEVGRDLATFVEEQVATATWRLERVSIEPTERGLLAANSVAVHEEVQRFLDVLRGFYLPDPEVAAPGERVVSWPGGLGRASEVLRDLDGIVIPAALDRAADERVPLDEAAQRIALAAGCSFTLSPRLLDDLPRVQLESTSLSVRALLEALCEQVDGLRWNVVGDGVLLRREFEPSGCQFMRLFDLRDALPGGERLTVPRLPEPLAEALSGHAPDFVAKHTADGALVLDARAIDELVRVGVDTPSWDEEPENSVRVGGAGEWMVVRQSPRNLEAIAELLELLEQIAASVAD